LLPKSVLSNTKVENRVRLVEVLDVVVARAARARTSTRGRSVAGSLSGSLVGGPNPAKTFTLRVIRIMPNLRVADIESAKSFYTDFLGLSTEEFNMGWVARYTSPDTGARVQLVSDEATAPEQSVVSVHTPDVEAAYREAQELGYEIVYPLTQEPWGVRRFFVRAPDGNVINVVHHLD
jgi:predicted enzyme related to lactoylglutathione lyase